MNYQQFFPHPLLSQYIDVYWRARNDDGRTHTTRILPDGCIDIIINLGESFLTDNGSFKMQHDCVYVLGTMTHFIDVDNYSGTSLFGIRFKPLGFSRFYRFSSLHEFANKTIEFEKSFANELKRIDLNSKSCLDQFFLQRLSEVNNPLSAIVQSVANHGGNITVNKLSREHAVSPRQLERSFNYHLGVSPKEFIKFMRYQHAMTMIRNPRSKRSLLDIALDCGYYDHSHLTNEIRRYTGSAPSAL